MKSANTFINELKNGELNTAATLTRHRIMPIVL